MKLKCPKCCSTNVKLEEFTFICYGCGKEWQINVSPQFSELINSNHNVSKEEVRELMNYILGYVAFKYEKKASQSTSEKSAAPVRNEKDELVFAEKNNKCPKCNHSISWDEKYFSTINYDGSGNETHYGYRHPYCNACSWSSPVAIEDGRKARISGYRSTFRMESDPYGSYEVPIEAPIYEYYWEKIGTVSWSEVQEKIVRLMNIKALNIHFIDRNK